MGLDTRKSAYSNALYDVDRNITPEQYCKKHMPNMSEEQITEFVATYNKYIDNFSSQQGISVPIPNQRTLHYPFQKRTNSIRFKSILRFFKNLSQDSKICYYKGNELKYLMMSNYHSTGLFEFQEYDNTEESQIATIKNISDYLRLNLTYGGDGHINDIIALSDGLNSYYPCVAVSFEHGNIILTFSNPILY